MPKGFLAVLSEPGEVGLDEFQDWYNNEHVPLRLNHIPSFLTGARFEAVDSEKPSWIALYDIDSSATFIDPSYTRLRENRSPREAALVKRLDVLDRRTCEVVFESENINAEGSSSGLALGNPTQWAITHGLDIEGAQEHPEVLMEAWKTITTAGTAMKGLIRSRLTRCIDGLKSGVSIPSDPEAQRIPKYFVLHELNSSTDLELLRNVLKSLVGVESTFRISEEREWKLYRAYPCIAQGNLQ